MNKKWSKSPLFSSVQWRCKNHTCTDTHVHTHTHTRARTHMHAHDDSRNGYCRMITLFPDTTLRALESLYFSLCNYYFHVCLLNSLSRVRLGRSKPHLEKAQKVKARYWVLSWCVYPSEEVRACHNRKAPDLCDSTSQVESRGVWLP